MNEESIMEFAGGVSAQLMGMVVATGIWIGDEVGYYRTLAGAGEMSADQIASAAGANPRLTREWLDGQAAAGLIGYDSANDTYSLSDEGALVLADDTSPVFMARGVQGLGAAARKFERIVEAFKGDGAMSWGDHDACLFHGTEWFFRTGYRANLTTAWIPALEGVDLDGPIRIADIGCGHGASAVILADALPNSQITGVDFHAPSINTARERAIEAGVADRIDFQIADAQSYEGTFDLVCFFDCLHDMGDPVGAMRHARSRLDAGGSVMLVEPFAIDGKTENMAGNPIAPMLYHASSMYCLPNSLSQDVGLGLGAQAGEARLREVATAAGFTTLERIAETPFNLILQVR